MESSSLKNLEESKKYPKRILAVAVAEEETTLKGCVEGNKLGLGTNLYSNEPTLLEIFGEELVNSSLSQRSLFMEQLAQIQIPES